LPALPACGSLGFWLRDDPAKEATMVAVIENRIPPPIVMVVTGLAMWALSWVTPTVDIPAGVRYGLVGVLLVFGISIAGLALSSFRRAGTTIDPVEIDNASSLVTTGIYAFTRNPMYVGLTTLLVTLAVLLSNAWLLLGPLFFVLYITRFQIIPEEHAMQARFGSAYDAYRARVRRWV
jgi:protein-S-isoprenylcysteine O-methyltransferase Ste14